MKEHLVDYDVEAEADLRRLTDWLISKRRPEYAMQHLQMLKYEVSELDFLADSIHECTYQLPKLYYPNAKALPVCYHLLTVIFNTEGNYVIVDKTLPSSLMTG